MNQGENAFHNRYVTNNCTGIIHVVKEGDSLYKIGKMHGVSVSALMYANPYVNVYNLQVGDELCVPVYNMPWDGRKEPRAGAGTMQQPQTMPAGGTMQQPRTMTAPENAGQSENERMDQESGMPEVMRMQESRLEYEIKDDSEL